MAKPKVDTRPVASNYAGPTERIVEYSHDGLGGLIAIQPVTGGLGVYLYRHDENVKIRLEGARTHTQYAIKYQGTVDPHTGIGDGSLEAHQRYIDTAVNEYNQTREDYAIVQREVTRIETPWVEVE